MNLILFLTGLIIGYFKGHIDGKPKYIYGYDNGMVNNRTLRKNRKTGAIEFILLAKTSDGRFQWHEMDSSHWHRFNPYSGND